MHRLLSFASVWRRRAAEDGGCDYDGGDERRKSGWCGGEDWVMRKEIARRWWWCVVVRPFFFFFICEGARGERRSEGGLEQPPDFETGTKARHLGQHNHKQSHPQARALTLEREAHAVISSGQA